MKKKNEVGGRRGPGPAEGGKQQFRQHHLGGESGGIDRGGKRGDGDRT